MTVVVVAAELPKLVVLVLQQETLHVLGVLMLDVPHCSLPTSSTVASVLHLSRKRPEVLHLSRKRLEVVSPVVAADAKSLSSEVLKPVEVEAFHKHHVALHK